MPRPPAVDLYSDTQTRPTAAMRRAMADAEVGDEQQGTDPTVNRLCARTAEMLGQEAGLFLPTGTMCNLVAVAAHTSPGDAIVASADSHIVRSETGGAAAYSGVITDLLPADRGRFGPEAAAEALAPGHVYRPWPRLVCLEQTHNFGGGTVWPLGQYRAVAEAAHEAGVPVHTDGARLFNATVASGTDPEVWGEPVESIWIDFTKGLGAPIGAVLVGGRDFIQAARMHKHRCGGAMRQAGIAAAGCLHALDHHIERLADDHANAARLAEGLAALGLGTEEVETNMVWIEVAPTGSGAAEFLERLAARDVRMSRVEERVRAVTHLDVAAADIETAIAAVAAVLDESA
ncbi:MAG: threonine aldolase family protein [bacterium]|nr:threonine aldolase family protein [bacterium]MCY3924049.1 threonine aldolase family protein [bacterium]